MRGFPGLAFIALVSAAIVAPVARAQPGEASAASPSTPPTDGAATEQAAPQPYAPAPPPPAYPMPYPAPYATRPPPAYPAPVPYGYSPWWVYEDARKSAGLAFLIEFLLPGGGSIYADHLTGAAITWGLTVGGFLLMLSSGRTTRDPETGAEKTDFNGTELAAGVLLLVGGRTYGLVDAIVSTRHYNERLRQRLGLTADLRLDAVPTANGGHVIVPALRLSF